MEHKFRQDDFEEFLQNQLKNHRMYPADNVWRNIHKSIHGDTRWPALTIAALLIMGATIFTCLYFGPKGDLFSIPTKTITAQRTGGPSVARLNKKPLYPGQFTFVQEEPQFLATTKTTENASSPVEPITPNDEFENQADAKSIEWVAHTPLPSTVRQEHAEASEITEDAAIPVVTEVSTKQTPVTVHVVPTINTRNIPAGNRGFAALNPIKAGVVRRSKFSMQFYVAPSISFRKLYQDERIRLKEPNGPAALNYVASVNNVVRHKPGTGIEAGMSVMYSLTDRLRVKTGLQFNMRQYSIQAYRSGTELANIALMYGGRLDTVTTVAMYRTSNGLYSTDLVNRYFQLSMPVGVEWEIMGNKKIQWNVAGSIQPTYLLNRNAYMITTNFKNYTESPNMVRQWNVNSNLETFISFKYGDFKWQVGPQVRYQPFSTFIPQYPIKELLLDYGVKVGISTGF